MNTVPVLNFQQFIAADGDQLTTDSRKVAAVHGKRHDNLIKLIRQRVEEAGERGLLNFKESSYVNQQGKEQPMFVMTKDGYQFLVGRMTGKKAVQHQWAFIDAFNAMAAYVKNQREGLTYRRVAHELECKDSARRGSYHGRGLNERKQELPRLKAEGAQLKALSQPLLPGLTDETDGAGKPH